MGVDHRREEAPREAPPSAEPRVAGPTEGDHQGSGALDTGPVEPRREITVSRPIHDAGTDSDFVSITGSPPSPRDAYVRQLDPVGINRIRPSELLRWRRVPTRLLKELQECAGWRG